MTLNSLIHLKYMHMICHMTYTSLPWSQTVLVVKSDTTLPHPSILQVIYTWQRFEYTKFLVILPLFKNSLMKSYATKSYPLSWVVVSAAAWYRMSCTLSWVLPDTCGQDACIMTCAAQRDVWTLKVLWTRLEGTLRNPCGSHYLRFIWDVPGAHLVQGGEMT